MIHVYNGLLLSHEKEWNNAICCNMHRPEDYNTEWSQTEKDKYRISLIPGILKKDTNELIYKTETDSETNLQ